MWTCSRCGEKVDADFDVCWSCGTSREGVEDPVFDPEREGVLDDQAYQARQAALQEEDLVTLATFWSVPEAHMARARLEAEGIPVYVADELSSIVTWGLFNDGGGVKLQVMQKDASRARALLAEVQHRTPADSEEGDMEESDTAEGIQSLEDRQKIQRPEQKD